MSEGGSVPFELAPLDADNTEGSAQILVARGEIDATNVAEFEKALGGLLSSAPVILDLSDVSFLDSTAYAALDRVGMRGSLAFVLSPSSPLRRSATIVGLPFSDDTCSARAYLDRVANHNNQLR